MKYTMTSKAVGTYEQYIAKGWTDALLVEHGYLAPLEPPPPDPQKERDAQRAASTSPLRAALAPGGPLAPLTQFRRFIIWKMEWDDTKDPPGWAKRPANWHTGDICNAHDESIQTDWETACTTAERFGAPYGVGFVFNEADGFFFLDIDKCLGDDGKWSALSDSLVRAFPGAYVEVSVSGKGLHIFGRGEVPPHKNKNVPLGLEFYTHKRFCALTGTNATGSADKDCGPQLKWLVDNYFPKTGQDAEFIWTALNVPVEMDAPLLAKMRATKSAGATFGQKATFDDLWTANAPVLAHNFPAEGRPYDASSADMALFAHLAFWTRKDCARMWRLAWASGLVRDKWRDRHEYVRDTLLKACGECTETYENERAPMQAPAPGAASADGYIPVAKYLTTDQANAKRIFNHFGGRIRYSEGRWYGWNGKVWAPQEKEAWKSAQQLSELVSAEAEEWKAKAEAKRAAQDPLMGNVEDQCYEALKKHSIKCEAKAQKEAALGELTKLISIDINLLDADPFLINCQNGIVDLRTGALLPHDQSKLMTKITPGDYVPTAICPRFESFILQIMGGDAGMVAFLQRWFGYCATGSVREQKFAIHHGKGSNGKGTLLGAIQDALGTDYADEMPEGMLTGSTKHERHPCDVADLRGQRMMTSSETKEDETMKEAFIKKATGGDRMKGRFMHGNFFSFTPTHKLQLQTNWPPRILGTDYAIWRRVMMIPYAVKFREPYEEGPEVIKDLALPDTLKAERDGILAWIVRGAVEWFGQGLKPPQVVLVATKNYRNDQDIFAKFVNEYCEVGLEFKVYFNLPKNFIPQVLPGSGICCNPIYPRYREWCDANGYQPLSVRRFTPELERLLPHLSNEESSCIPAGGDRTMKRTVRILKGIR